MVLITLTVSSTEVRGKRYVSRVPGRDESEGKKEYTPKPDGSLFLLGPINHLSSIQSGWWLDIISFQE